MQAGQTLYTCSVNLVLDTRPAPALLVRNGSPAALRKLNAANLTDKKIKLGHTCTGNLCTPQYHPQETTPQPGVTCMTLQCFATNMHHAL